MMQFLLNQEAQFAADVAKSQERFDAGLIGLTRIVGQLASAQQRTDEQLRETDARLRETDARLRETDSRLNIVVDLFDRHRREDHGHPHA